MAIYIPITKKLSIVKQFGKIMIIHHDSRVYDENGKDITDKMEAQETNNRKTQHIKMKIEIKKHDGLGAFGGFAQGSVENGTGIILIDTKTIFKDGELIYEDGEVVLMDNNEKKRVLIETMIHEFGHALEEFFEAEFDEDFIEKVTMSYNKP